MGSRRTNYLFNASNRPASAYGSRRLTGDWTGALFRVVRASDSATYDVAYQADGTANLAGLTSFLSGTTGAVDLIYDQTGGGNHATQTTGASRPVANLSVAINGGFVPTFANQFMTLPAGAISASTRNAHGFAVAETPLSFGVDNVLFQMGTSATVASQGTLQLPNTTYLGWVRANPGSVTQTVSPDCRPSVYEYHMGTTAQGGLFFYQNDETLATVESSTNVAFTGGQLGSTATSGLYKGYFFFGCALFYNARQDAATATALKQKMASMFGITPAPSRKRLIIDGDSIAGSYTAALNYYGIVPQARRSMPECRIYNISQSGFQLQNTVTNYASTIGALLTRYGGANCVVVEQRSINDINIGSRTGAQLIADIQTVGNAVTGTGAVFVVAVTTPAGLGAGPATERATYVSWLQANAAGLGWHLIDITSDPTVGTYSAGYYPDGIHPNVACTAIIAPYWAAAIGPLL